MLKNHPKMKVQTTKREVDVRKYVHIGSNEPPISRKSICSFDAVIDGRSIPFFDKNACELKIKRLKLWAVETVLEKKESPMHSGLSVSLRIKTI